MRTIKFRGKDENGKWHFGHLIKEEKKSYIIDGVVECNDEYITIERWQQVIPETVGQFTGLYDIKGNEIYEGDRVTWGQNGLEMWHRYAIVILNPDIQFKIYKYVDSKTMMDKDSDGYAFKFGKFAYAATEKYLEVIGNIHE